VILFDGYGRVTSRTYGFKCYLDSAAGRQPSGLAKAWEMDAAPTALVDIIPTGNVRSQFGFVVFNSEEFANIATGTGGLKALYEDPQVIGASATPYAMSNSATGVSELAEEKWLDDNSAPQLVNRNNGTLVRAE
jgi:hypothetical protein